jgi:uncharacterized protein YpmB
MIISIRIIVIILIIIVVVVVVVVTAVQNGSSPAKEHVLLSRQ